MTRRVAVANLPSTANAGTTEIMGRKRTPERSKLVRAQTPAFSRRQRGGGTGEGDGDNDDPKEAKADPGEPAPTEGEPIVNEARASAVTEPVATVAASPAEASAPPDIVPPDPSGEPWPDATPAPMQPVEPGRPRSATVAMPTLGSFGGPPDMPRTTAPPPLVLGEVENPAHLPGPREIPGGSPDDPAPAPGLVPPGDSRSLRCDDEFALIYRVGTSVITRTGRLGTRGQWRVVEYPTSAAAANSYAKECSRFVSDGFSDYRE